MPKAVRSKRARKSPYKKRNAKATIVKAVKQVIAKQVETKVVYGGGENNALNHNIPFFSNNLLAVAQGNTDTTRLGDAIQPQRYKVKFQFFNKHDRPTVMYRLFVFQSPTDYIGSSPPLGELFRGSTGNKIIDVVNHTQFKILKHKIITVKDTSRHPNLATTTSLRDTSSKVVTLNIPMYGNMQYRAGTSNPKEMAFNLKWCVIAYDQYGSLATDNIASFAYCTQFYYKDA